MNNNDEAEANKEFLRSHTDPMLANKNNSITGSKDVRRHSAKYSELSKSKSARKSSLRNFGEKLGGVMTSVQHSVEEWFHQSNEVKEDDQFDQIPEIRNEDNKTTRFLYFEEAQTMISRFDDINMRAEELEECMKDLPFLCFLGGNSVQEMLCSSCILSKLSIILIERGRKAVNTNRSSTGYMFRMTRKSSATSSDSANDTACQLRYSNVKMKEISLLALKCLSSMCRDSKANQKRVAKSGLMNDLLALLDSQTPTQVEKKWCIHILFIIFLTQAQAIEKVMNSPQADSFLVAVKLMADQSLWESWDDNEARLLLHVLGQ